MNEAIDKMEATKHYASVVFSHIIWTAGVYSALHPQLYQEYRQETIVKSF